jgi:hypothetical protein
MSDPGDPLASAIKGATGAVIEWTAPRIAELVARIRGHSAAVASDGVLVESIRHASKSEEARFLKTYVTDKEQRRIVDDGLTLYELSDKHEHHDRLKRLRTDLLSRYGTRGLRAAEIVERGVLGLFLRQLMREGRPANEIVRSAFALIDTVERWTYFVQVTDNVQRVAKEVRIRALANQPGVFIVLGHGAQKTKAKAIVAAALRSMGRDFGISTHDSGREFVAFIGKTRGGRVELTVPAW